MGKPIESENDYKTNFDKQLESAGLLPVNQDNLLSGTDQSKLGNQFTGVDLEKYEGTIPNISLPFNTDSENKSYLDKTYRQIKADQQGTMSKMFNAVIGGVGAGVLGGLENIALIPQSFSDDFEKNGVAQVFSDMKQFLNENTPIHTHTDVKGLSDIDETADVWQGLKSVLDSAVSFGLPGAAIVRGTSYMSRLGRVLKPTRLGKALNSKKISNSVYNKANAFLSKAQNSKAFQQAAQAGFAGTVSNQLEGTVMAIELYDQVVKDLTSQGIDEAKAREIAQVRANEMEETNRSMLLTNVFQLHGLTKALAGTRNIMTAPGIMNNIKASLSFKTPSNNIFLQNLVEAGEEMYQSSVQQSLETLAKKDAGLIDTNKNKYELIGDYLFSDQALYEGALGFFGGALQRTVAATADEFFSSKANKGAAKSHYDRQQKSMKETSDLMAANIKDFAKAEMIRQKAQKDNDPEFEKLLGDAQFLNLAATSFEMGTTGHLEGILDDMSETENSEVASVLKDKLLNWEQKYVEISDQTPNTREVFMRSVTNDIYHEQLDLAEKRKANVLSDYKTKTLNLAKNKKVEVKEFGIIKEAPLSSHINIDENGVIEFSEFIDMNNKTTINSMESFQSTQGEINLNLFKSIQEVENLNQAIEFNTEALKYAKSPERLAEIEQTVKAKEKIKKVKDEVDSSNVTTMEEIFDDEDVANADLNPEEFEDIGNIFDEKKEERAENLREEVSNFVEEDIEVNEDTKITQDGDKQVIEKDGEVTVEKVETIKPTVQPGSWESLIDKAINSKELDSIIDQLDKAGEMTHDLFDEISKKKDSFQGEESTVEEAVLPVDRKVLSKEQKQQPTHNELKDYTKKHNILSDIVDVGTNKIAYATSEFDEKNISGNITREDILDENGKVTLNPEYVYNLHPDNMLPGTEVVLKAVDNPNDLEVYDGREKVTYKDWKNSNPTEDPNSKIPIEILVGGKRVGFIHEPSWITLDNVQAESMSIEDQKEQLNKIRKYVIENGEVKTKVTDKSYGKLLTRDFDSLANNTPNSLLALYIDDKFTNSADKSAIPNIEIIGDQEFETGTTYNLLRVQDNKFIATPVRHKKLDSTIATTVVQAITAYTQGAETEGTKAIAASTGYDVLTAGGLSNYIKLFFPVKNVRDYKFNPKTLIKDAYNFLNDSDYNTSITGRPFIIIEEGNVIMGREGTKADSFTYVTKGSKNVDLTTFEGNLLKGFMNLSIEGFQKNPSFLDSEGKPNTPYDNYMQYAMNNIDTNVYGINIGEVDVYTKQPVIRFDEGFLSEVKERGLKEIYEYAKEHSVSDEELLLAYFKEDYGLWDFQQTYGTEAKDYLVTLVTERIKSPLEELSEDYDQSYDDWTHGSTERITRILKNKFGSRFKKLSETVSKILSDGNNSITKLVDSFAYKGWLIKTGENIAIMEQLEALFEDEVKLTDEQNDLLDDLDGFMDDNPELLSPASYGMVDEDLRFKYFQTGNTQSHKDVLQGIIDNKHPLAPLAKKLISLGGEDIKVQLVQSSYIPTKVGIKAAGLYLANENLVKIAEYTNFRGKGSESTIIHEILHALSFHILRKNPELKAELNFIYKEALKHKDKFRDDYAISNLDEFLVAIYTDAKFIQDLQKIKSVGGIGALWNDLLAYFKKIFKFNKEEQSLFDDAFYSANKVLEAYSSENKAPQEFTVNQVEIDSKIRHKDGARKRYVSENTAIKKARELNKSNNFFTFKTLKVMGEKGDRRVYWSVKAEEKEFYSPTSMSEEEVDNLSQKIKDLDKNFEGLTYLQAGQVITSMISHVSNKALESSVNLEESLSDYGQVLATNLAKYKSIPLDKIGDRKRKAVEVLVSNYEATLNNFEDLAALAIKELNNDDKYKLSIDEVTNDKGEVYDIATYEVDPKSGVTATMKRIMGGFTKNKKNFLNMQEFVPFDEAFNTVISILAGKQHNMEAVVKTFEENYEARPWLKQATKVISNLDKQLQNQFLSRMIMSRLEMKYPTLREVQKQSPDGEMYTQLRLDVINTNRNDIGTAIHNSWRQQLKTRGLFLPVEGTYKVNNDKLNEVRELAKEANIENFNTILNMFGIDLSNQALELINKHGLEGKTLTKVFKERDGLISILIRSTAAMHKNGDTLADTNPINQGKISSLSYLESRFNKDTYLNPNNFRTEEKQIYSYIQHTMVSDRIKGLKDGNKIKELKDSSFTKHSYYLSLLDKTNESQEAINFRERFNVFDSDLKAFETNLVGNKQKASKFTSLAEAEHELARVAYFNNNNSKVINGQRPAKFVLPTMSDKTRVLIMEGLSVDLVGKDPAEMIYDRVVFPEIDRILTHVDKDIKSYNNGARIINFFPLLNSIEMTDDGVTLFEFLNTHKKDAQTKAGKNMIKAKLLPIISDYIQSEINSKLNTWNTLDIMKYIPTRKGFVEEYVVNNLINTSEIFQLFVGDPAMFFKTKVTKDIIKYDSLTKDQQLKITRDTFTNVNKRLAMLIAPGTKLANNETNSYFQIMLKDRESSSIIQDYLETIMGKEAAKDYLGIEGADAQEFTTWQEHLYVMEKLGDIEPFTNLEGDVITKEHISEAREIFESKKTLEELNDKQVSLLNNLMQVMKPVYSGQVHRDGVQQVVYIKSSAFPLLPQLTQGLEIDKLRVAMEEMQVEVMYEQNGLQGTVRASFGTANKIGSIADTIDIWNEDGTLRELSGSDLQASSMKLTRENFKIQQNVPFKSGKKSKQDTVNIGTQERKLLFANLFGLKDFEFKGKNYDAEGLYNKYNDLYDKLFRLNLENLYKELGIDSNSDVPISKQVKVEDLATMLQKEATERNYPLGDIKGLEYKDGKFTIPLWLHQSSDKYESLLNSIVANRVIGLKMPGYTYVLGTEEGFRDKTIQEFDKVDDSIKSKIIFTDSWEGQLKPARFVLKETGEIITDSIDSYKKEDIEFRPSQVIAPMKFRDEKGNLINLMEEDGKGGYTYMEDTPRGYRLKMDKFDPETLKLFGFRIPTSGLMSMASIEIVGFTPLIAGDIILASRDFTIQMGSDFDVDKIVTYMKNTILKDGKLVVDNSTEEKSLQNDIIELHQSIFAHKSDFVQTQIHKPLNFDFAKEVSEIINNKRTDNSGMFTPLSDEYQKTLMLGGSAGMAGTGVYSLDVVFHAAVQALQAQGTPIRLASKDDVYQLNIMGMSSHDSMGEMLTVTPSEVEIARNFLSTKENLTNTEINLLDLLSKTGAESAVTLFKQEHPNVISDTLAEFRYISDVLAEAQNYSVDNANEAIMGKINDNEVTFNARKVFNLFGVDKSFNKVNTDVGAKRMSVPNLFMVQTSIMDHLVPMMRGKNSTLADYDPTPLYTVRGELDTILKDLGSPYKESEMESIITNMTEQELFDMVGLPLEDMDKKQLSIQSAIVDKFLELDSIGTQINSIQTSINTDSKKLGKSLFDNLTMLDKVIKLDSKLITIDDSKYYFNNAEKLLGEYSETRIDNTYRRVAKGLYIKPTTVNGFATIHGLMTAVDIYKEVFPYTDRTFNDMAVKLGEILGKEETTTKLRQDLLKTLKSFVYSQAAVQKLEKTTNETREELFIDSEDNQSLTSYLKEAIESHPKLRKYAILNSLEFNIESNGQPSLLKWNNASNNEFEDQFYMSFLGMLQDQSDLPNYNGRPMDIQDLAQHLVTYSYLEGGIQQATQFIRHIPVEYLEAYGIAESLNNININNPATYGLNTAKVKTPHYVADIIRQYIQHNPRKAEQLNLDKLKEEGLGKFFTIGQSNFLPTQASVLESKFVAYFDVKSVKKGVKNSGINLYELMNGSLGVGYYKIPVLGVSGMSEYNIDKRGEIQESIVHGKAPIEVSKELPKGKVESTTVEVVKKEYKINTDESKNILKQINNTLAKVYSDVDKQFKVRTVPGYRFEGAYKEGVIYLSEGFLEEVANGTKTKAYFERVFLEEYTHALTKEGLSNPTKEQAKTVESIIRYYNRARKKIESKYGVEKLVELEERFKPDSNSPKGLTDEERAYIYGGINVVEFVGHIMTNSDFQEMLNEVTYEKNGKPESFWKKIKELLTKLVSSIANIQNLKDNSLTTLAISDVLDLIGQGKENYDYLGLANSIQEEIAPQNTTSTIDKDKQYVLPSGKVIVFNEQQWEGLNKINDFINSDDTVFTLAGYAGTGKTTIVKKILDNYNGEIAVSAPTHKAKNVIATTTNKQAYTLQALLGLRPNVNMDNFNPNKPEFKSLGEAKIRYVDLVVVDEASMINKKLYQALMKEAEKAGTKVLFMGDPAQIPPVHESKSEVFKNIDHQLTKVERTSNGNPLLLIFDKIRANINSIKDNFNHITKLNKQGEGVEFSSNFKEYKEKVISWFKSKEYAEDFNYAKIITWTNDSVSDWNKIIRKALIQSSDIVADGDVLMAYDTIRKDQYSNIVENSSDYKVTNVERGTKYTSGESLEGFYTTLSNGETVFVLDHSNEKNFNKFQEMYYAKYKLGESQRKWKEFYAFKKDFLLMKEFKFKGKKFIKTLDYGYAVTAHKSQGSTYNKVAIIEDDMDKNSKSTERNQIKYVAFSRAKENVISLTNKAGKEQEKDIIEEIIPVDDDIDPNEDMGFMDVKDILGDLSPFRVSEFRSTLSSEDRKLFNRLKREGIIKTKCK